MNYPFFTNPSKEIKKENDFFEFIDKELSSSLAIVFFIFLAKKELKQEIFVPEVEKAILQKVEQTEEKLGLKDKALQNFVSINFLITKSFQGFWETKYDSLESYETTSPIKLQLNTLKQSIMELASIENPIDFKKTLLGNNPLAEKVLAVGRTILMSSREKVFTSIKAASDHEMLKDAQPEIQKRITAMIDQFKIKDDGINNHIENWSIALSKCQAKSFSKEFN